MVKQPDLYFLKCAYKIQVLKCTKENKAWLFNLHKLTMKEYIDKVYGWDEQREKAYLDNPLLFKRYHLILVEQGEMVGAINFYYKDDVIKINRIEVLPDYQNKGIGSAVLDKIIKSAKNENMNVELRVFKINPACRLYSRKGFKIFKESDTHFYMRYEIG